MQVTGKPGVSSCGAITVPWKPVEKGGSQRSSCPAQPTPGLGSRLRRGGCGARDRRSRRIMRGPTCIWGLDSHPRHLGRSSGCPPPSPSALDPHEDGPRAPGMCLAAARRRGTTLKNLIGVWENHVGLCTINFSGRVFFTQEVLGQKF